MTASIPYAIAALAAAGSAYAASTAAKDVIMPKDAPAIPAQSAQAPTAVSDAKANNSAANGPAATNLTGYGGIDPASLGLGKNTLLGS